MKLLWDYVLKYKKILFGALALATVNRIFQLLDPQIFRLIVDNYANRVSELATHEFMAGVGLLLLAGIGAAFVSRVANNFQIYYVDVITQKVGTRLYAKAVGHSFSLPYQAFEDQRSGELLQKLQKARSDSENLIKGMISTVFFSLVGILFVLIYAFFIHWSVGLVYFLIIPTLGMATFFISKKIKTAQKNIVVESADLAGSTTETLRNVQLVKSLGLEKQEINRLNMVNEKILGLELTKVRLIRKMMFVQGTLINALRAVLMLLMLWLIYNNIMTLGEFFSLLFYSFFIFTPLTDLGAVVTSYQESQASMGQLNEVLKTPAEKKPEHPRKVGELKAIKFSNVDFAYASSSQSSIQNINLEITAGQTVAFVGLSGSGKTTLIKLLAGLYPPTAGKIEFNNINSREIDFEKLRNRIGLVSQETQLFAGSIRENLLFVNPRASDKDCLAALKSASVLNIVERGEQGLNTKIGEGGLKLSGGEKQRLAIARALLRKPDLIIFDEATSSLDSLTEKEITKTIEQLNRERKEIINILIAHRLSTVIHADVIYVLEKGRITGQGSHADLIKNSGLYAAMWREQSGE